MDAIAEASRLNQVRLGQCSGNGPGAQPIPLPHPFQEIDVVPGVGILLPGVHTAITAGEYPALGRLTVKDDRIVAVETAVLIVDDDGDFPHHGALVGPGGHPQSKPAAVPHADGFWHDPTQRDPGSSEVLSSQPVHPQFPHRDPETLGGGGVLCHRLGELPRLPP